MIAVIGPTLPYVKTRWGVFRQAKPAVAGDPK
jgi:hypothetical protein